MQAFFIRFSEKGQYKPRNTSTGSVMFGNLQSNVVSFVLRSFDWDGGTAMSGEGGVRTGRNCSTSRCVK